MDFKFGLRRFRYLSSSLLSSSLHVPYRITEFATCTSMQNLRLVVEKLWEQSHGTTLFNVVSHCHPYSVLQKYFQCSSKTVTAAKVHCILFGRGGVPVEKFKFTHQCVSPQVLEELTEFLHRDDVSRASSCRSVLVDGEETAVRYWQDTVKGLINQYLLEFPNGVKRTYIYTHLPTNFRMNTMLAGLCNICDDFGHSNFDELCTFIEELCSHSPGLNGSALVKDVRPYQNL